MKSYDTETNSLFSDNSIHYSIIYWK